MPRGRQPLARGFAAAGRSRRVPALDGIAYSCVHRRFIADIGTCCDCVRAQAAQLHRDALNARVIDIKQPQPIAEGRQMRATRAPMPLAAPVTRAARVGLSVIAMAGHGGEH